MPSSVTAWTMPSCASGVPVYGAPFVVSQASLHLGRGVGQPPELLAGGRVAGADVLAAVGNQLPARSQPASRVPGRQRTWDETPADARQLRKNRIATTASGPEMTAIQSSRPRTIAA